MENSPTAPMQAPYLTTPAIRQRLDLLSHLLEFGHQMVVIQGDAGSGRSRLLTAVAAQARANWRVIPGNGATIDSAPTLLAALSEALELGEHDAGVEDLRARLAEIELGGQLCILTLDNAEGLDEGGRAMLFSLAYSEHQRGDLRVVITGDADSNFSERLQAAAPAGAVIHVVDVPPLDAEELKTLALSVLPASADDTPLDDGLDLDQLAVAAAGNPGRMLASLRNGGMQPIHPGQRASNAARAMGGALRGFKLRKYGAVLAAAAFVLVAVAIGVLLASRHGTNTTPGSVEISLPPPDAMPPAAVAAQAAVPAPSAQAPATTTEPVLPPTPAALPPTPEPVPAPEPAALAEASPAPAAIEAPPALPASDPEPPAAATHETTPSPAPAAVPPTPTAIAHPRPAVSKAPTTTRSPAKRSPKPNTKQTSPTHDESLYSPQWLKRQKPQHYVLQLFGSRERAATTRFIRDHGLDQRATVLEVKRDHAPWFVVVTGLYTTRAAANAAIHTLPAPLVKQKPWPRTVATFK